MNENIIFINPLFSLFARKSFGEFRMLNTLEGYVQDWEQYLNNIATNGCQQSYAKLFQHFYPLVFKFFTKDRMSKEVALELSQDVMLKVWSHSNKFDSQKGSASSWIYTIARNTKFDFLRKAKGDLINLTSDDIFEKLDEVESLDNSLEDFFTLRDLEKYFSRLNHEQKEIMEKIYFLGMTQLEVAFEASIPIGTVKSRVRLALTNIKKMMEEGEQ